MKLIRIAAFMLIAFNFAAPTLNAQTLDEVLNEHFAATGADVQAKSQTVTMTGAINQSGMEIPFKMVLARPGKLRLEGTFQGLTFIQTYNGTEGWNLNPFAGSTEPEPIPADQLSDLKEQADMDGMLYNYAAKGYQVSLEGTEEVEGTNCYKLKIIKPDTSEVVQFLDADSYLLIKSTSKSKMMGVEVNSETYFSNYLTVNGVAFAGKVENRYNGVTGEVINLTKIEFDLPVDDAIFNKPVTN